MANSKMLNKLIATSNDSSKYTDEQTLLMLSPEAREEFMELRGISDEQLLSCFGGRKKFKHDPRMAAAVQASEDKLGEKWWHRIGGNK